MIKRERTYSCSVGKVANRDKEVCAVALSTREDKETTKQNQKNDTRNQLLV
jgi:hypothetical protein